MEKGTLYQIRNLIDRRNITKHPKSDVNAAEDFLEVVIISHILTAVMTYLGMNSLDEMPSTEFLSQDIWMSDDKERRELLTKISTDIVNNFVDLSPSFSSTFQKDEGTAYDYACEVLSLGLFFFDFKDAVREGAGDRIFKHWKYLLLLFKASGRSNYSIEALTLLTQYNIVLPPNLAEQLKWSRFVNTSGLPGHNISCDLHNEHLNRLVKIEIEGLGANKSKKAITRSGKAIGVVTKAVETLDEAIGISPRSSKHSTKGMEKDVFVITDQLRKCDVFNPGSKLRHKSFNHLKTNIIKTLDETSLKEWMVDRFSHNLEQLPILMNQEQYEDNDSDCEL